MYFFKMHNPLPDNGDTSFSFPRQCVLLKINGAWPLKNSSPLDARGWLYHIWSTTIIVLIALTCWAQSAFVFHAWGDILTVTECGCTVLMGIHNLLRLCHLAIHRPALKELITEFVNNIWISRKYEKEIAEKCEKDMFIMKLISGLLFVLIWMYVLVPLFDLINLADPNEKPFPYKMVFPYDANHGWQYPVTYVLTSLAGFGVVTTLFSEDSLFGYFVVYTCGQFQILHKKIDAIIETGVENAYGRAEGKLPRDIDIQMEYNRLLRDVIKHHSQIILFAHHLELFFSPMILINYTISSFLICLTGFQIAAVKMTMGNLAKLVIYIVSALSQLFILCFKGDRLIEDSELTAWKLYDCDWQGKSTLRKSYTSTNHNLLWRKTEKLKTITNCEADLKFVKHLQIAIQRSQKPLRITAYKFSVLSLKSFTAILSTSLSYFTLLQTLVEKSE